MVKFKLGLSASSSINANLLSSQKCEIFKKFLETNFWIWGFEYNQAIPKQRLGEKYEVDFLLKRIDGKSEIVEIESFTDQMKEALILPKFFEDIWNYGYRQGVRYGKKANIGRN